MDPLVIRLIETLSQALLFVERRTPAESSRYLEAVIVRRDLTRCCELLQGALGPPLKDFGQSATLEPRIQQVVAAIGGIRIDQCLFFAKGEDRQVAYAALWPWASDPRRITLKVGLHPCLFPCR